MLATNRQVLTWLSMYPANNQTTNFWKGIAYIMVTLTIFCVNLSAAIANLTFFLKFVLTNLEESLIALMICSGCTGLVYSFATAIIMRCKMKIIFEKLALIYDSSKCITIDLTEANLNP